MKLLAHRGFWQEKEEQNSLIALQKSFEMGLGIETDLRDRGGGGSPLPRCFRVKFSYPRRAFCALSKPFLSIHASLKH